MQIRRVVFNLNEYKMFVLCEQDGLRKNLKFTWQERSSKNLPPKSWTETVQCEMDNLVTEARTGPRL